MHDVAGGQGPALILIHGFPENWSSWAPIMPRLAERFRVVAADLRAFGGWVGREAIYLDYFLRSSVADPESISDEDVQRYACA